MFPGLEKGLLHFAVGASFLNLAGGAYADTYTYIGEANPETAVFMSSPANWADGMAPDSLEHDFVIEALPEWKLPKIGINIHGNIASLTFKEGVQALSIFGTEAQKHLQFAASGRETPLRNDSANGQVFNIELRQFWISGGNRRIWDANAGDFTFNWTTRLVGDSAGAGEKIWELAGSRNMTFGQGIKVVTFPEGNAQVRVEKTGTGSLELCGDSSSLEGAFDIMAGTVLVANKVGFATGTGPLTAHAGTKLMGTGIIGGVTEIQGSLAPGNSGMGKIFFRKGLTLAGTLEMKVSPSGDCDQIIISGGSLTFGGELHVTAPTSGFQRGQRFRIFEWEGEAREGAFRRVQLPPLPAGLRWQDSLTQSGEIIVGQ